MNLKFRNYYERNYENLTGKWQIQHEFAMLDKNLVNYVKIRKWQVNFLVNYVNLTWMNENFLINFLVLVDQVNFLVKYVQVRDIGDKVKDDHRTLTHLSKPLCAVDATGPGATREVLRTSTT